MSRDATGLYSAWAEESTTCPVCGAPPKTPCDTTSWNVDYAEHDTHWDRTLAAPSYPLPERVIRVEEDDVARNLLEETDMDMRGEDNGPIRLNVDGDARQFWEAMYNAAAMELLGTCLANPEMITTTTYERDIDSTATKIADAAMATWQKRFAR